MRVATFNILHGRSLSDGAVDADRLRAAVADLDADVLGLQEVDLGQPRSHGLDLTSIAASAYQEGVQHRYAPTLVGTPGHGWRSLTDDDHPGVLSRPTYGIAMVTRLPVISWHLHRLPAAPTRSPVVVGGKVLWLRDEPRAVLAAVVLTTYGPMTVATTHLSFLPGWNALQLVRTVGHMRRLPAPRLLLGDLNLPRPLPGVLTGWRSLVDLPSYPAQDPRVQLDHVIAAGHLPPVLSAEAREMPLSDHRAIIVDL